MRPATVIAILGGAAIVGVALTAGGSDASAPTLDDTKDDGTMSPKKVLYEKLRSLPELHEMHRLFVMLTAYGETGGTFRPTAHNDTPSEVAASAAAYDNNPNLRAKLEQCGYGRSAWVIGSGGYGGRLVPYFGDDMFDIFGKCVHPTKVFDANYSIISTLKVCYTLQHTTAFSKDPTVKRLRLGFYGLGAMQDDPSDDDEQRFAKYAKHAEAVGLGASFVNQVIPPFPSSFVKMFQRLINGGAPPPSIDADKLVGPFSPDVLPACAPAARARTKDAGWSTVDWWVYGTHCIRVDWDGKGTLASNSTKRFRWCSFVAGEVIGLGVISAVSTEGAAQRGAQFFDDLWGKGVA
jgi:hypothetical protein